MPALFCTPIDHKCVAAETYAFLTASHQKVMRKAPELIWESDES